MRLITTDRRFAATLLAAAAVTNYQVPSLAVDDPNLRLRDTSSNLLSNDYYYIFGKVPPRKLLSKPLQFRLSKPLTASIILTILHHQVHRDAAK